MHLDPDHAALVLLVSRQPGVWLVHAAHQGMRVGIDGQNGVALRQRTGRQILPAIPQLGQPTRCAIAPGEIYTTCFTCP